MNDERLTELKEKYKGDLDVIKMTEAEQTRLAVSIAIHPVFDGILDVMRGGK